ncbi:carbohydrate esterase family 3 protein [Melanomma pulvis-pyrius CBS 109.77]|uniref:Carbohydrate esterase family 3 protein n=1 Tax=Melanomma pulvis-pyrius CBS 109.77 TaxID=1314802 RepID=A0A6A6XEG1_9PLEO|nr:carbohydrate esterase family 3 protein [Melanomma pulvis-pyrius CBS 109.77]
MPTDFLFTAAPIYTEAPQSELSAPEISVSTVAPPAPISTEAPPAPTAAEIAPPAPTPTDFLFTAAPIPTEAPQSTPPVAKPSVASEAPPSPPVNSPLPALRVLPLGDSITWGWQPPNKATNGYRLEISKRANGSPLEFVGTQHSGDMTNNESEGYPGFTIKQIQNVMVLDSKPNVVLLHAGTNDLNGPGGPDNPYETAPTRLSLLIDQVNGKCPDAVIIVAKIIQGADPGLAERITAFNDGLPAIVANQVSQGRKVILVDQSVVGAAELVDGLHPSDAGYAHMGDIWFEGIQNVANQNLITAPV